MLSFAPRIPARLLDEIERQSRRSVPIAEMNRCVGRAAAAMGLYRPSYEQVRVLVHTARRLRRKGRPPVSTVAAQVAFRVKPPEAILMHFLAPPPPRLRDHRAGK
ncbi:MAG TPA: hypothetical protein VE984_06580 [Gaiellaceae bacterium]|nr:hypothetical protein [Gaiellaceae bacterium]